MSSFWNLLISRVRLGEMEMEEALRRDNYYSFVKEMPGIGDAARYVMDTPYEELPPVPHVIGDAHAAKFQRCLEFVQKGRMCAYDAAQAYFDSVSG